MATLSSILAWKILCSEESGGLPSTGLQIWTRLSTTQQNRQHQIKENTGPLTVQDQKREKIHPESRQSRALVEPASLLLPWTKKIKKRKQEECWELKVRC